MTDDSVEGQYDLVQATGRTRTLTVNEHANELEIVPPADDDAEVKRLSPRRAHYLAEVTNEMVDSGAILQDGGFVRAVLDWAEANADRAIPAPAMEVDPQ